MSDTRLRELERRWKETGSSDDEAAYLLERVRVGDLTQERLELAAYCGHEGARVAVRIDPPEGDANRWVNGLRRWGVRGQAIAALALAQSVLPSLTSETGDHSLEPVLASGANYLLSPSADLARQFERLAAEADVGMGAPQEWSERARHAYNCAQRAITCVWVDACGEDGDDSFPDLVETARAALLVDPTVLERVRSRLSLTSLGWIP